MKRNAEDIVIDYYVSPWHLESLQDAVLNDNKRVRFVKPYPETTQKTLKLLSRFAEVYSRINAGNTAQYYEKYKTVYQNFNVHKFNDAIKEVNEHLFISYVADAKMAIIAKPKYLSNIESIVMKKGLNRAGWLVQETTDFDTKERNYIVAPRQKEYKTKENQNIRNTAGEIDSEINKLYSLPIRKYFRKL